MVFRLHGSSASFARMVQLREANFLTGQGIPEPVPTTNNPVLEAREITKSFGGIRALKGVSLQLLPGEVHALVGENGAGKSTLIKVLTGAVQPDSGEIWLRGERVENTTPALTRALGISVVYQEPALFPDLTVAENLALGKETRRPWHRVAWKARTESAETLLRRVGARILPNQLAGELSMPEQQLVEIAKALDANTSVLILDEPTASLGEQDAENLFRIIDQVRAAGTAVLYISHRFEELFRLAHRVTVLRDGNSIETRSMAGTNTDDLIRLMVGRDMDATFPPSHFRQGEIALEVRGISSADLGVKNVSLAVRRGEILGLAGLVGAGRTQLAELIFGLAAFRCGRGSDRGKASRDPLRLRRCECWSCLRPGRSTPPWCDPRDVRRNEHYFGEPAPDFKPRLSTFRPGKRNSSRIHGKTSNQNSFNERSGSKLVWRQSAKSCACPVADDPPQNPDS